MMTTFKGGQAVGPGFYFDKARWEITTIPPEGGELKGTGTDVYLRIPVLAMLALAPILGAVYVMFLPFIAIAMAGQQLGIVTLRKVRTLAGRERVAAEAPKKEAAVVPFPKPEAVERKKAA
jgi:hypothetical protein